MSKNNDIERELAQKELENDLADRLRNEELDREWEKNRDSAYNPIALGAFNFILNLGAGYILLFIFNWFFGRYLGMLSADFANGINTIFHVVIFGIAVIAVITKKSPWEKLLR